jgi:hypothetical protein
MYYLHVNVLRAPNDHLLYLISQMAKLFKTEEQRVDEWCAEMDFFKSCMRNMKETWGKLCSSSRVLEEMGLETERDFTELLTDLDILRADMVDEMTIKKPDHVELCTQVPKDCADYMLLRKHRRQERRAMAAMVAAKKTKYALEYSSEDADYTDDSDASINRPTMVWPIESAPIVPAERDGKDEVCIDSDATLSPSYSPASPSYVPASPSYELPEVLPTPVIMTYGLARPIDLTKD